MCIFTTNSVLVAFTNNITVVKKYHTPIVLILYNVQARHYPPLKFNY